MWAHDTQRERDGEKFTRCMFRLTAGVTILKK
jgi:hypothetical protein